MDALQAALLRTKLPHVFELLHRRKKNAELYLEILGSIAEEHLRLPQLVGLDHTYNQFVVRTERRDELRSHLETRGIDCPIYYPTPLHLQPALFLSAGRTELPEAERAAREVLALPVHPALGPAHIERVARDVLDFFRR